MILPMILDYIDSANRAIENACDRIEDGELEVAIVGLEYAKGELNEALDLLKAQIPAVTQGEV